MVLDDTLKPYIVLDDTLKIIDGLK